jgi:hypothetical protein
MKFTKLLVLSALWLVGLSVSAADFVERTAPKAPTSTTVDVSSINLEQPDEFVVGNYYAIYNVGAKEFFTEGNSWGTQASLGAGANLSYFSLPDGKTLEDATLIFNDYSKKVGAWKQVFFDSNTAMFVDRGSQANFYWQVVPVEGQPKTYRLQASPSNPTLNPTNNPGFVGVAADAAAGAALSPFLSEGWIDWQFFGIAEWNDYGPLKAAYDKSQELKAAIVKAEKAGIAVDKWVTVYNNLSATVAELETAIAEVIEAQKNDLNGATGLNPKDATVMMVNPTFDTIGNFTGWSGTAFGAGGTTWTNAEWYQAAKGADAYQDVNGLPAGYFIAGVKGFYRAGSTTDAYKHFKAQDDASKAVQFYVTVGENTYETNVPSHFQGAPTTNPTDGTASAKDEETEVTYYVPNTMKSAGYYMHDLNLYDNFLLIQVGEEGKLRIGVKKTGTQLGSDWAIFDDFSLTYVGKEEMGLYPGLAWVKLKDYPNYADTLEHKKATKAVVEAYLEVLNSQDRRAAITDQAGVDAYVGEVAAQRAAVDKNLELWVAYENKVAEAKKLVEDLTNEGKASNTKVVLLNTYVSQKRGATPPYYPNGTAPYIIENRALDNAQIEAEIEIINGLIEAAKFLDPTEGEDVTRYLTNADFSKNKEGWTGWGKSSNSNMPTTGGSPNICAESYDANNFDLYQVVKGDVPQGVYEISVQGFTRIGRNDGSPHGKAWTQYQETSGKAKMPVYVYLNDNATNFKDVHDEPQTKAFYADNTVATIVKEDGSFTGDIDWVDNNGYYAKIGEQDLATNDSIYFPNTMTGAGYAFAKNLYVNSAYGAVVNVGDSLRLGVKGSTNGANWSIYDNFKLTFWGKQADKVLIALNLAITEVQNLNQGFIGKNVVTQLANSLSNAQTVAETKKEDGEALFAALGNLYAAKAAVQTSQEIMNKLAAANDSLLEQITAAGLNALLKPAKALRDDINTRMAQKDINDAEVEDLLNQIHQWMKDIEKFVELQEWADKLNEAQPTEDEVTSGLVSSTWMNNQENLAAELEIMLNPENAEDAVKVEEVDGLIEQIKVMIDTKYIPENIENASDANPINLTKVLKSPNFTKVESGKEADQIEGWTATDGYEGLNAEVFGYFNKTFDVYQDLHGLPEGIYEVRNQAYYRFGEIDGDYNFYKRFQKEQKDSSNVFLYAENQTKTDTIRSSVRVKLLASGARESLLVDSTTTIVEEVPEVKIDTIGNQKPLLEVRDTLMGVISGKKDSVIYDTIGYVPNDVTSANGYINEKGANRWQNKVIVKLSKDGVLRLGMKKQAGVGNDWTIMDNFQLFYYGKDSQRTPYDDPSGIVATEQKARVLRTEYFTIGGMRTLAPQQGIAIMRQTLENGNVVVKKVNLK